MVTCEWTVREAGGVAFVEAVLTAAAPRRVRLTARVEGPVWPPRRNGVPEREWSDGELTATVAPDRPLAVGFATPAAGDDPPVEVVDERPADPDDDGIVATATPDGVVRALGDGRPPRDAVPAPTVESARDNADSSTDSATDAQDCDERAPDPPTDPGDGDETPPNEGDSVAPPDPVTAWLDAIDRRLGAVEGRPGSAGDHSPSSVAADTAAAAAGDELAALAPALGTVAERADALAGRCRQVGADAPPAGGR